MTGPAYSKARERHGGGPGPAVFEADAARDDIPASQDGTAFGLGLSQVDGTTAHPGIAVPEPTLPYAVAGE